MKTGPSHRYKLAGSVARRKTSHDVFDGTLQKTQIWLNDIMTELDWQGNTLQSLSRLAHSAPRPARSVNHRRGGTVGRPTAHAGAGLLLRRLDAQGKTAQRTPQRRFPRAYQRRFQGRLHVRPESIARAVFRCWLHTSDGEIDDIKHILPKALDELWPKRRPVARATLSGDGLPMARAPKRSV